MDEDAPMLPAPITDAALRLRADAELLRASFAAAAAKPRMFAEQFYARLFELAPGARALFPAHLHSQQEKFVQTLSTIIDFADDPAPLVIGLRQLGARHQAYGTQPLHYAMVGEALLWTLDRCLETGLTHDARDAWRRLYGRVAAEMLSGQAASGTDSAPD
jgi:hemoglobin-like flavoprotein